MSSDPYQLFTTEPAHDRIDGAARVGIRVGTGADRCRRRLWLFTDARRLADPRPAVARLPMRPGRRRAAARWRAGPGGARTRPGADLPRAASGAGGGWRRQAGDGARRRRASARRPLARRDPPASPARHQLGAQSRRPGAGRRAGARLAFLSPVFPTLPAIPASRRSGPVRWACLARAARIAGGTAGRRRWRQHPAPATPPLPCCGSDWRVRLIALCLLSNSVSQLP